MLKLVGGMLHLSQQAPPHPHVLNRPFRALRSISHEFISNICVFLPLRDA